MKIFVDAKALRSGNGTKEYPFQRISEAAKVALPGDEVLVYPGVYREYVDPANAGTAEAQITYRSVEKGAACLSKRVHMWCWILARSFAVACA